MTNLCLQERLVAAKEEPRLGIHSFHRFFGKLIPAIPAAAVELFTKRGDLVLDPFCGSGTTLVEAIIRGRNAVGVDVNPLAVLITRVKTSAPNPDKLLAALEGAVRAGREILSNGMPPPPYCVNLHHWYRPGVIRELSALHNAVSRIGDVEVRSFLTACLSAVNRNVSNADPQHVFPGYSKRLRRLDAERGRRIDVFEAFASGAKKRVGYIEELGLSVNGVGKAEVLEGSADRLPDLGRPVDLVVTNPPYISSVRYLETLKLEMSWAGFFAGPEEYRELDRLQIGSERYGAAEHREFIASGVEAADAISRELFDAGQTKMSLVVGLYFKRLAAALDSVDRALKPGGTMVFKLSPSEVRRRMIPTPEIVAGLLCGKEYAVLEDFQDDYNPNSRSLLTARNYYSGRMDSDRILVLRKP
jgi:DNA modification methylase